jgi:hypothetical protein
MYVERRGKFVIRRSRFPFSGRDSCEEGSLMLVDWGQQNVHRQYKESDRRLLEAIEQ